MHNSARNAKKIKIKNKLVVYLKESLKFMKLENFLEKKKKDYL